MKRLVIFGLIIFPSIASVYAQEDLLKQPEEVPIEKLIFKKDQIPESIINTVSRDFSEGKPIERLNFKHLFQNYGLVIQDTNNLDDPKPQYYSVLIVSEDGSKLDAEYSSDGKLIRSHEILKKAVLPRNIELTILKNEYNGWHIIGDRERITNYKDNISKRYIIRMQKDNKKQILYFDENVNILKKNKSFL